MNRMHRLVAVLVLCLALPLSAQIAAGPDRYASFPQLVPSRTAQQVDMASNGTLALVVWQETRGSYPDIYAARVDSEGNVLDPSGIQLSDTQNRVEDAPHVIWDGEAFLVTWVSRPLGPRVTLDAMTTRVFPNGAPLLATRFATGVPHGLAINNGNIAVVLSLPNEIAPGRSRCMTGFLDRSLEFGATGLQDDCDLPRITTLGSGYLMAWRAMAPTGEFIVRARRLNAIGEGDAIGPVTLTELGAFSSGITIAAGKSGSDAIVAVGGERLAVVRVTQSLTQHRADPISTEPGQAYPPATVIPQSDGGYDVLVHHFSSSASLYRFSSRDRLTVVTTPNAAGVTSAAGAVLGGRTFGVFAQEVITGQFIFASEQLILISRRVARQSEVAMTMKGSEGLIAWLEDRGGEFPALVASLMDRNGVPYGNVMVVDPDVDRGRPAVGSAGEGWWIAWTDERTVTPELHQTLLARHVTAHGHLGPEIVLSETANLEAAPSIASNGDTAIIVWAEGLYFNPALYSAKLGSANPVKHSLDELTSSPSVVWNGKRYLLAANDVYGTVSGAWLDANAIPGPSFVLSPVLIITPPATFAQNPSLVWNGEMFLVTYEAQGDITAVTIDAEGFPRRDVTVARGNRNETLERPRASWDGRSFLVTWNITATDRRNTDIAARRVSEEAEALGSAHLVARSGLDVIRHDLTRNILAYSRVDTTSGSPRVFTKLLFYPTVKQRAVN